jgi:hypothetical protein
MSREMKVGLAVIGVLLTAFSGVLYKRLHKDSDLSGAAAERPVADGAKLSAKPAADKGPAVARLPSEIEAEAGGARSKHSLPPRPKPTAAPASDKRDPFAESTGDAVRRSPAGDRLSAGESATSAADADATNSEGDTSSNEAAEELEPRPRYGSTRQADDAAETSETSDDDSSDLDERYADDPVATDDEVAPATPRYRSFPEDSESEVSDAVVETASSDNEEFDPIDVAADEADAQVGEADAVVEIAPFPERSARAARKPSDELVSDAADSEFVESPQDPADFADDSVAEQYAPGPDDPALSPPPRATIRRSRAVGLVTAEATSKPTSDSKEAESVAAGSSPAREGVHVVAAGESIFDVARQRLGSASRWMELYDLNNDRLGPDLEDLPAGLQLELPVRQACTSRVGAPGAPRRR